MDKRNFSERDICSKFITPALQKSGWDLQTQIWEEKTLTDGRIIVRGKMVTRGKQKRADYVLYLKPNIPVAVVEAKENGHAVGDGIQQALTYADMLKIPFAFSSNGDGFVFHDRTGQSAQTETNLALNEFPSPAELEAKLARWKNFDTTQETDVAFHGYYDELKAILTEALAR